MHAISPLTQQGFVSLQVPHLTLQVGESTPRSVAAFVCASKNECDCYLLQACPAHSILCEQQSILVIFRTSDFM